jgi:hypothetical protein
VYARRSHRILKRVYLVCLSDSGVPVVGVTTEVGERKPSESVCANAGLLQKELC